jgi:hypothetical protein
MLVLRWTMTPNAAGTACTAAVEKAHGPSGAPESTIPLLLAIPLLELELVVAPPVPLLELVVAPPVPLLELVVAPPVPPLELGPVTVDELVGPAVQPVASDFLPDEQAAPTATTNISGKPRYEARRIMAAS